MTYLEFLSPIWLQIVILAVLVFVVVRTRVYGALAFFLACNYNSLIVRIGTTTLVPIAFGALGVASLLHLRKPKAFRLHASWRQLSACYLALMGWVLVRGLIGLRDAPAERQALLFLVIVINVIPVLLADGLSWDDQAVAHFAQGFLLAVVVQMLIVWHRAFDAGLNLTTVATDFWLTKWASDEVSPFNALTGIMNYHWYSWNLGIAVLTVLFVLRRRDSRYRLLELSAAVVFTIACVQQVAIVGSRQSIIALILAVFVTAWTRVRKALLNIAVFVVLSVAILAGLRVLADLEPLPPALMHGAATVGEAFDPVLGRGQVWRDGFDVIREAPLVGTGLASDDGFSLGHNIILNTLANFGLVGLAVFALLVVLYVHGPLRSALRQGGAGIDINRGLVGAQLFLLFTAMASGSVIASSGLFWLGAILVRRAPSAPRVRVTAVQYRPQHLSA
jgi:hypothetical protein